MTSYDGGKMICVYLIYCVWIHKTIESADMLISSAFLSSSLRLFRRKLLFQYLIFVGLLLLLQMETEKHPRKGQTMLPHIFACLLFIHLKDSHWQIYRWINELRWINKAKSSKLHRLCWVGEGKRTLEIFLHVRKLKFCLFLNGFLRSPVGSSRMKEMRVWRNGLGDGWSRGNEVKALAEFLGDVWKLGNWLYHLLTWFL
jgi:hypothetical protein